MGILNTYTISATVFFELISQNYFNSEERSIDKWFISLYDS
ncbi:hypothetical protein [Niastella sp. OAS944]|nr:hypothetical protein [Chitinophagaceae bacterium OAS944]